MHCIFLSIKHSCLAALLLFLMACGRSDTETLVVYSAGPRPLAEAICRAFEAETGMRIELFTATNGQIMAKLEAEKYRPRADIVILASQVAAEALKQQDRLLAHSGDWWESTRTEWHDTDRKYFATSAGTVGIATRSSRPVPETWKTLFNDPGAFGRVTMPSPSRSGSAGDFLVAYTLANKESAWHQYRSARSGGLEFAAANNQAITGLLIGSYDVILAAVDYLIYRQVESGAPLKMSYPEPGPVVVARPIAILNSTGNSDGARRFVDFYFSDFAQNAVAATHLIPARHDIPLSSTREADGLPQGIDFHTGAALREYRTILRRFQMEIERAAVVR